MITNRLVLYSYMKTVKRDYNNVVLFLCYNNIVNNKKDVNGIGYNGNS